VAVVKQANGHVKVRAWRSRKPRPNAPLYKYLPGDDGRHRCIECGRARGEKHGPPFGPVVAQTSPGRL
jgi:hypothetical protein